MEAEGRHVAAAVVPVLDEATAIGDVVRGLSSAGACCVFVVDGGSRDGTARIARQSGATVIDEPRRGYGRACLTGADAAALEHPIVVFLDGDGSCDPADLSALLAALAEADVALGRRTGQRLERGALPWHARAGNALVAAILRHRTGHPVHDLSPFKAMRREALHVLDLDDPGFGWTVQLVARSLVAGGLRVVELPIAFRRRRGGSSKVSGSLFASVAAGRQMLRNAWLETRRRPVIALMAKAPRAGHAKTRLAVGIGDEAAVDFWRACLHDLGRSVRSGARTSGFATVAIVPAPADAGPVAACLGPGWEVVVQHRQGLGGAITDAVVEAIRRRAPAVVAISGDNPTLPAGRLDAALIALRRAPAALGPSPDGGYHLVGWRLPEGRLGRRAGSTGQLASRLDRVFGAARLGGAGACETTRRALVAEGLAPTILETFDDVDVASDLPALRSAILAAAPDAAPATRAWFTRYDATLAKNQDCQGLGDGDPAPPAGGGAVGEGVGSMQSCSPSGRVPGDASPASVGAQSTGCSTSGGSPPS